MAKTSIMPVSLRRSKATEAILKTGLLRFARNDTRWGKTLAVTLLGALVFLLVLKASFAQDAAAPAASPNEIQVGDTSSGKISLDLKGVDIIELFKILSMKMNTNIVPIKEVTGRVNVFLNNVTFEDALDIILISNGLAAAKEKNIITIMPVEKYTQQYGKRYAETRKVRTILLKHASPRDVLAALNQLKSDIGKVIVDDSSATVILVDVPENLDLMEKTIRSLDATKDTQIFELRYAKAEDVKNQLAGVFTPGSSQVEMDARTNKIVVSDLPEKMKKIKKMIEAFDSETRQVLIEAQIVQIILNDKTQYGIDWERLFHAVKVNNLDFKGKYPITGLSTYGQMSVGTMAANDFNIVVQALNTLTKANILSRPRIAVVNNQEASILIGAKEVYFSQTQSQSSVTTTTAESVNYVDVGVKLNVTPNITDDGFVVMKIRPEVSSVRETAISPLGSKVPVVETSQAETTVKVRDNAMILIAGLMKDDVRNTRTQFPFLGKLPFLRWFFGSTDSQKNKTELAIFLTPRIITGDIERVDAEKEEVRARGVVTKRIKERLE
jgi:general secretion pathway protein D